MKAPIISNSITERVVFTGLYVPESAVSMEAGDHAGGKLNAEFTAGSAAASTANAVRESGAADSQAERPRQR